MRGRVREGGTLLNLMPGFVPGIFIVERVAGLWAALALVRGEEV